MLLWNSIVNLIGMFSDICLGHDRQLNLLEGLVQREALWMSSGSLSLNQMCSFSNCPLYWTVSKWLAHCSLTYKTSRRLPQCLLAWSSSLASGHTSKSCRLHCCGCHCLPAHFGALVRVDHCCFHFYELHGKTNNHNRKRNGNAWSSLHLIFEFIQRGRGFGNRFASLCHSWWWVVH